MKIIRKPDWLKISISNNEQYSQVKKLLDEHNLHTICVSGRCPNLNECWGRGTATLMILGDVCTRSCKFCATKTGKPLPPDVNEPVKIARTVNILKLKHVVITSVDRDDLEDYGASHWAVTITEVKKINPDTIVEVLVPDFQGKISLLKIVTDASPDIISHNIETVSRLTPVIRSKADYKTSLQVLHFFADEGLKTKSGFMLGLGETKNEVLQTIRDVYDHGCTILTIGQYLQPTQSHQPVVEYIQPEIFEEYKQYAFSLGFKQVESGPLVRSSYMAEQSFQSFLNTTNSK
jgi:lipoic acid synthetase